MKLKKLKYMLLFTLMLSCTACTKKEVTTKQQEPVTENETEQTIEQVSTIESKVEDINEEMEDMTMLLNGTDIEKATYFVDKTYENTKENTMVSPLSLNFALGMVAEGATGETRNIMNSYLNSDSYGEYVQKYMEYAESLNNSQTFMNSTYKNVFEIADSVWVNENSIINEDFKSKVTDVYKSEIDSFDGSDASGSAEKINDWVKGKTHEMIPSVITPDSITDDTRSLLVNTVYFESNWIEKWDYNENDLKNFTDVQGNKKKITYLTSEHASYFYENEKATGFGYKYQNGLTFIGILPKQKGEFKLADLKLDTFLESETTGDIKTKMPKLDFSSDSKIIKQMLSEIGMGRIFSTDAEFDQILENENLAIDDIIQKCKIELDENGTKASAVTSILMVTNQAFQPIPEYKEVYLDRPFAFMIYDRTNKQIVFIGKVVNV